MTKTDSIIGLIIGFLIGLFLFIPLKTFQIAAAGLWLILVVFPGLTLLGLFIASVIGKRILAVYQLAKFFLVGALNTFVDLGVLNLLMWLSGIYAGVFFILFKGTSFLAAATNSYFWNKHWTFGKKNGPFSGQEYIKFLVIVGIGLLINVGVAALVVNIIGPSSSSWLSFELSEQLWANIGAFSAIFVSLAWNFIGSKFIVFKK